jgi:hypothetical protein
MRSALLMKLNKSMNERTQRNLLGDIAGCGSQAYCVQNLNGGEVFVLLDNSRCRRCDRSKRMDVGHDVVASLFFLLFCNVKLVRGEVLTKVNASCIVGCPVEGVLTRLACICVIASSGMGKPSSFSAMAKLSQSLRQVKNRF